MTKEQQEALKNFHDAIANATFALEALKNFHDAIANATFALEMAFPESCQDRTDAFNQAIGAFRYLIARCKRST